MNYFFKILVIIGILSLAEGKKVLSYNPILNLEVKRYSSSLVFFKLNFESTTEKVMVGFGKDYYPADVVVCQLLNDCVDSYVVGLKNVKKGFELSNLEINADVSQKNAVKGTNDISNYLVTELKNADNELIGYSYQFTKTISTGDIFDVELYNDDPEVSLVWMYEHEKEFYYGKVSVHGMDLGKDRQSGTKVANDNIITDVNLQI